MGVLSWKGMLAQAARRRRAAAFGLLAIIAATLTGLQLGFAGLNLGGAHTCYAMVLLAPIAAASLLLGRGAGLIEGLIAGIMLLLHAQFQPLDLFEHYFLTPLNSVLLLAVVGLVSDVLFALALRNDPRGARRIGVLAAVCLALSVLTVALFALNVFDLLFVPDSIDNRTQYELESYVVLQSMGGVAVQVVVDFAVTFVFVLIIELAFSLQRKSGADVSIRFSFRARLFAAVAVVFLVIAALNFAAITVLDEQAANRRMTTELDHIVAELHDNSLEDLSTELICAHVTNEVILSEEGTIAVFYQGRIASSNNAGCPTGASYVDLFGAENASILTELSDSGQMRRGLYYELAFGDLVSGGAQPGTVSLGFMKARQVDDYMIMLARPASLVFANRTSTMLWIVVTVLIILLTVFVVASRLLGRIVGNPIDKTNEELARITGGDLGQVVDVRTNAEFSSLTSGINATVDALKGWISEAKSAMESELEAARTIQASALPRTFPAFPDKTEFDIYASMDPAREVGGDFYDFFLIDDSKVGFLVADVSGKGVPAALFMMAAKTEIENRMVSGMDVVMAVAGANHALCASNDALMFVTMWVGVLDLGTGELTFVNAGHNPPLVKRSPDAPWEWVKERTGMFLGTFDKGKYRAGSLTLEPGGKLLLYTDGVTEAFNVAEEEYGPQRLEEFVAAHADLTPCDLVHGVRADVAAWAEGAVQSDDVTLLVLEYRG